MAIEDGGSAFPMAWTEANEYGVVFPMVRDGMTLRDWFAGQAFNAAAKKAHDSEMLQNETPVQMFARLSYAAADAMLAERSKKS